MKGTIIKRFLKGALLSGVLLTMLLSSILKAEDESADFLIDINLVDQSVSFFLDAIPAGPWIERFDRDGDDEFDIFDVDLTVDGFLNPRELTPCESKWECDSSGKWKCKEVDEGDEKFCLECESDDECGTGAYCSDYRCVRSCGITADSANSDSTAFTECYGRNKACEVEKGKCYKVENTRTSCHIDSDCLSSNYCSLGMCEPLCYSNSDCPGADWMCSKENRCIPRPEKPGVTPLDPTKFQVMFGKTSIRIDSEMPFVDIPVVIMDKEARTEAIGEDALYIPYRLKVSYAPRSSADCTLPEEKENMTAEEREEFENESERIRKSCEVTPFLTMEKPIGMLRGESGQKIRFNIDEYLFSALPNGYYSIKVELIAGNGNSTGMSISYDNPSSSGRYSGMIVFTEPAYTGSTFMGLDFNITKKDIRWNELLKNSYGEEIGTVDLESGLPIEEEFEGKYIYGEILSKESPLYLNPERDENGNPLLDSDGNILLKDKVQFVGLYQPLSGKVRMIFQTDLPKNYNAEGSGAKLSYKNLFGRDLRRMVIMDGELDTLKRSFRGLYRETISGLGDAEYTIGGSFSFAQVTSASGTIKVPADREMGATAFDSATGDFALENYCPSIEDITALKAYFTPEMFKTYLSGIDEKSDLSGKESALFGELVQLEEKLQDAIDTVTKVNADGKRVILEGQSEKALQDTLREKSTICENGEYDDTCINMEALTCAVHFYGHAIRESFVRSSESEDHTDETRRMRMILTHRFTELLDELVTTYNYAAGDKMAEGFRIFMNTTSENGFGKELDATIDAYEFHEKARAVIFDPFILQSVKMLSTVPQSVRLYGNARAEVTEFGFKGVAGFIKRATGQMDSSITTLSKYLNLKRRQTGVISMSDRDYLNLLGQELFLEAVTLLSLQESWIGTGAIEFMTIDYMKNMLSEITDLRIKLDSSKNPLGYNPDEIFLSFLSPRGSSDDNYEYFKREFLSLAGEAKNSLQLAVNEFSRGFSEDTAFDDRLFATKEKYSQQLDSICGSEEIDYYEEIPCGSEVTFEPGDIIYECGDSDCTEVEAKLEESDGTICRPDIPQYFITLGSDKRNCFQGEVGSRIRAIDELKSQQEAIKTRLKTLVEQLNIERDHLVRVAGMNEEINDYYLDNTRSFLNFTTAMMAANAMKESTFIIADGIPRIVGFSNDVGAPAVAAIKSAAALVYNGIKTGIVLGQEGLQRAESLKMMIHSQNKDIAEREKHIQLMMTEGYNLAAQHNTVERQILTQEYQIQQLLFTAQKSANYFSEANKSLIEYLIGQPQNSRFQRNFHVMEAEQKYEKALKAAYEAGKSMEYEFNYPYPGELANRVFTYRTIPDLESYAQLLDSEKRERWNFDENNGSLGRNYGSAYTLSLRDLLFPKMREKIDPEDSRKRVTKEMQFNRKLLSSKYRFKRSHSSKKVVEQIEIPFSVWLQEIEHIVPTDSGRKTEYYTMVPNSISMCNAHIQGIKINTKGNFLPEELMYDIERGGLDDMRTCYMIPDKEKPQNDPQTEIRRWKISDKKWNSSLRNKSCINAPTGPEQQPECTHSIFVDRTLGASDYTLIIPNIDVKVGSETRKLFDLMLEDGDVAPVIGDIELTFYYRSRGVLPHGETDSIWN